jgi:hypothetical protein
VHTGFLLYTFAWQQQHSSPHPPATLNIDLVQKTAKVDGPQISFSNRKFADLKNLLDLRTFSKCGALRPQSFL